MIIYSSSKLGFREDVRENRIEKKIYQAYQDNLGYKTSQNEVASWQSSMLYMSNILDDSDIPNDASVCIEYMLPRSLKRIDFIIAGKNEHSQNSIVIIELKQWQHVEVTDEPGVVKSFVGGAVRELTHPSYQAWSYGAYMEDFSEVVEEQNIQISTCAYLHNCESSAEIRSKIYMEDIERAPVFIRNEASKLTDFIKKHVRVGDSEGIMYQIENGEIRPTKKLAETVASMLKGNSEFVMIDDQKLVFERAMRLAKNSSRNEKNVLIVNGGPGTGKSVVAINLLVRLLEKQLNTQYVSKNAAPREVYSRKLTGVMTNSRYRSLFVGSGRFTNTEKNTFDALIVDEAHRLNEKSGLYSNLGENQIKEIIKSAKFTVFFLDEDQRVAFNDIGSKDEIRFWANNQKAQITEMTLASQFRCNGSEGYLAWLDNYLGIRETANLSMHDLDFDFQVCATPKHLYSKISKLDKSGYPARVVAGYCWDWLSSKDPKAYDIELEGLKMKWNLKSHGSRWIIHPDSISEAGCIHTCQGLEVDYIGVIVGPDLKVRDSEIITDGFARSSRDKTIRGFKKLHKEDPELAEQKVDRIIKNTYKTLMTRGMKGCFIHCLDPETNTYFKNLSV